MVIAQMQFEARTLPVQVSADGTKNAPPSEHATEMSVKFSLLSHDPERHPIYTISHTACKQPNGFYTNSQTQHFQAPTTMAAKPGQATLPNGIPIPEVPLSFVPVKAGEVIKLGPLTCRIMEDGSNTGTSHTPSEKKSLLLHTCTDKREPDNRLGVAELILPPKTPGPPPHWHEMVQKLRPGLRKAQADVLITARRNLLRHKRHNPFPRSRPS
jgi:hypothetical protein